MKKIIILCLTALMLAGCSSTPKNKDENKNPVNQKEEKVTAVFGKVNKLLGNEVEFDVAKNPLEDNDQNKPSEGDSKEESTPGASLTDPIPAGEGDVIEQENKLSLEYTGEHKTFVMNAGVKVIDLMSGSEVPMSSIKEGSVLMISMNDATGEVVEIGIIEK